MQRLQIRVEHRTILNHACRLADEVKLVQRSSYNICYAAGADEGWTLFVCYIYHMVQISLVPRPHPAFHSGAQAWD